MIRKRHGGRGIMPDIYAMPKSQITEEQLLQEVIRLCDERGILHHHDDRPYRARRRGKSEAGFPDLVVCGTHRAAFIELKKEDQRSSRLSRAQYVWMRQLQGAGETHEVWRPSDLLTGHIARELDALNQPAPPPTMRDRINREFARAMAAPARDLPADRNGLSDYLYFFIPPAPSAREQLVP